MAQSVLKANPNSKVYITGHSLGGQLSYIAAAEAFRRNNGEIKKVVVFNGFGFRVDLFEHIGNQFNANTEFKRLSANSNLIQNHSVIGDFVPNISSTWPFTELSFNFHHFGQGFTYTVSQGAPNEHSMYTFIDKFKMYGRGVA